MVVSLLTGSEARKKYLAGFLSDREPYQDNG